MTSIRKKDKHAEDIQADGQAMGLVRIQKDIDKVGTIDRHKETGNKT